MTILRPSSNRGPNISPHCPCSKVAETFAHKSGRFVTDVQLQTLPGNLASDRSRPLHVHLLEPNDALPLLQAGKVHPDAFRVMSDKIVKGSCAALRLAVGPGGEMMALKEMAVKDALELPKSTSFGATFEKHPLPIIPMEKVLDEVGLQNAISDVPIHQIWHRDRAPKPDPLEVGDKGHVEVGEKVMLEMPAMRVDLLDLLLHPHALIKAIPDAEARSAVIAKLVTQLLQTLKKCHDRQIAFRDLKLENVMIDVHGDLHLIDFGSAEHVDTHQHVRGLLGTPDFMPPELLTQDYYSRKDKFEIDLTRKERQNRIERVHIGLKDWQSLLPDPMAALLRDSPDTPIDGKAADIWGLAWIIAMLYPEVKAKLDYISLGELGYTYLEWASARARGLSPSPLSSPIDDPMGNALRALQDVDPKFYDFMTSAMLHPDPSQRATLSEVDTFLKQRDAHTSSEAYEAMAQSAWKKWQGFVNDHPKAKEQDQIFSALNECRKEHLALRSRMHDLSE